MKGFSRTEFIIVDNEPFMLEMNTVPVWRQKAYFRNNLSGRNFLKICLLTLKFLVK
jgi:D-alanine-D-alanine ligase-like ATP-grasp enzyme